MRDEVLTLAGDSSYFLDLYARYCRDRHSVPADWRIHFEALDGQGTAGGADRLANALIDGFRRLGHLEARLDPLDLRPRAPVPALARLRDDALAAREDRARCRIGGEARDMTIGQLQAELTRLYSGPAALEAAHVADDAERDWLFDRFERVMAATTPARDMERALSSVVLADEFETFMRQRLPTKKRFGMEGAEATAVAINEILNRASGHFGQAIMGGMHRGRLNILTTILQKPLPGLFAAILGAEEDGADPRRIDDVPYHLGHVAEIGFDGGPLRLTLLPHPSHLMVVAPVATGMARGAATPGADDVLCLLMHTDAAFAGQGVVGELMQLAGLQGYNVNGTIHLIVNNQIGFTTDPAEARTATYCTDVAKMTGVPVIHVNGDDVGAVVRACGLALDWRRAFRKDILIDLVCYRRNGHNELDEPRFTHPGLWAAIDARPSLRQTMTAAMQARDPAAAERTARKAADLREALNAGHAGAATFRDNSQVQIQPGDWTEGPNDLFAPVMTGVAASLLRDLGRLICRLPAGITPHDKVAQFHDRRLATIEDGAGITFATAEVLAFASLLHDGSSVRLSGQDCVRGTFTQRHLAVHDLTTGDKAVPLDNAARNGARFEAINSPLSEYAVLGFEYGHSLTDRNRLVLWEAQFGDFLNGAQIAADQYVTTAETKWGLKSGLTVLLPHGHEGQGPDHSSARIERLLQSCADDNIVVTVPTTPANLFHLLRRQIVAPWRRPLFVAAPKSMLRLKSCTSTLDEMAEGTAFRPVITDAPADPAGVRRVILCSGKIFYDLAEAIRAEGRQDDIAVIRVEQLYPLPVSEILAGISRFPNAAQWIWCQEEPRNQGAWSFVAQHLQPLLAHRTLQFAGRRPMAVTATGSLRRHEAEQAAIVAAALSGDAG